jgi:hypothetical protein
MKNLKEYSIFESGIRLKTPFASEAGEEFAKILTKHKGVKESPMGSNKGKEVDSYLIKTGLKGGYPWCMAFVYSMFDELSKSLRVPNPLPKTAGVKDHWAKADPTLKIGIDSVRSDFDLLRPGQIFIMSRPGKGLGHTGIILSVNPKDKSFVSIEGNTNDQKSGEGDRVGINKRRISDSSLIGFIDYFKNDRTSGFEENISKVLTPSMLTNIKSLPSQDKFKFPEAGVGIPIKDFDSRLAKFKEFLQRKGK